MIRAAGLALGTLLGGAFPALAGQYQLPAQCVAHLTVQSRGCLVSHYYRCASDAEGQQWRVDIAGGGPFFLSLIDAEAQWLISEDLIEGYSLTLDPSPADPASLTTLFATGEDRYDFTRSLDGGPATRVRGYDRLTGKRVTIDGVELEETDFEYREIAADGTVIIAARGQEYVHRGWRQFFSGRYDSPEGEVNRAPVRFDEPGDTGFLSETPEYDCTDQMAGAKTETLPTGGLIAPVRLSLASSPGPVAARPKE